MGSVTYSIVVYNRVKLVTGTRLNPYLAAKYIQDKGYSVDHLPSQRLASEAYFADLNACVTFANIYVTALGKHVTRTSMFFKVPPELRLFRMFLDVLGSYYRDQNSPITTADLEKIIFQFQKGLVT